MEGLFAQMSWGGLHLLLYYSSPVLCFFFSLWWDGPGCDWLSARHDVWQLFIREAMKGPPTVKLLALLKINQEEIF